LPAFFFVFLAATDFHLHSVLGSNTVAKNNWKERERLVWDQFVAEFFFLASFNFKFRRAKFSFDRKIFSR